MTHNHSKSGFLSEESHCMNFEASIDTPNNDLQPFVVPNAMVLPDLKRNTLFPAEQNAAIPTRMLPFFVGYRSIGTARDEDRVQLPTI